MKTFIMTENHIKLLRRANVDWLGNEHGAPYIDHKRPYGNSEVYKDMISILVWPSIATWTVNGVVYPMDEQNDFDTPEMLRFVLDKLHRETEVALQIILRTGSFEPGLYTASDYGTDWKLK